MRNDWVMTRLAASCGHLLMAAAETAILIAGVTLLVGAAVWATSLP